MTRRVIVVGGGIAGLTVAERLTVLLPDDVQVELRESSERLGGKLRTSPFAGREAIDEGADAFLARVPSGVRLAERVGLSGSLTWPTDAPAAVWYGDDLHAIPSGLVLGVPRGLAGLAGLAASRLFTVRGKLRAAVEPLLPRTADPEDSVGRLVRSRFGDEIHERLVDALVGSIYATDTDRFSLAMVPQLAELATGHRSLLLSAQSMLRQRPRTPGPTFYAPSGGMQSLADATRAAAERGGATIRTDAAVSTIERDGSRWRVDGEACDAVVAAIPAARASTVLVHAQPDLAAGLGGLAWASVVIVTLAVPDWPQRLRGRSGYLVPKPAQRLVTAASFGSQKWAHWQGAGEILRISLGRDGLDVTERTDDELVDAATTDVGRHVDLDLQPVAVRVSRWPAAFPQYRPGHRRWLSAIARETPPGLFLTGASYRGIGVPACISDAEATAVAVVEALEGARNF